MQIQDMVIFFIMAIEIISNNLIKKLWQTSSQTASGHLKLLEESIQVSKTLWLDHPMQVLQLSRHDESD